MAVKDDRPNLIVVGVGHSGTTILVRLLTALGWKAPQADKQYAEHQRVRQLNRWALRHDSLQEKRAQLIVAELEKHTPWVIKDPRFTVTLHLWKEVFEQPPTVLRITKDVSQVKASYRRRGEMVRGRPGNRWASAPRGLTVDEQLTLLEQQLQDWPGPIITVDYEQIAQVTKIFVPR